MKSVLLYFEICTFYYYYRHNIDNSFVNSSYKGEDQKERNRAISKAIKKKLKLE